MEEGGERWSKPHVATLSLHSLFELRKGIMSGTVMLDVDATNLLQVTGTGGGWEGGWEGGEGREGGRGRAREGKGARGHINRWLGSTKELPWRYFSNWLPEPKLARLTGCSYVLDSVRIAVKNRNKINRLLRACRVRVRAPCAHQAWCSTAWWRRSSSTPNTGRRCRRCCSRTTTTSTRSTTARACPPSAHSPTSTRRAPSDAWTIKVCLPPRPPVMGDGK